MSRKKSMIERNNDALLFWQYFGPIIYWVVGVIVVSGLIFVGYKIKSAIDKSNEQVAAQQQQELTVKRQEIVDKYIAANPKTFGKVTRQWNKGNMYYAESEYGIFTIIFDELEIVKVFVENKAGQTLTLYE